LHRHERNINAAAGTPSTIQCTNVTWIPANRSSIPMPIRFGGVPTGVATPPIDAPNDVISIVTSASCRAPAVPRRAWCVTTDSPIGNIMAVAAVLLIHIESSSVIPPYTTRMRQALVPTYQSHWPSSTTSAHPVR
jgi:hypothetical protein